jgi:hypothetical protein
MILSFRLLERPMASLVPKLRLVRPAPYPLGLYVRAGSIGREDLQNFIMSNGATFTGVVFEAKRVATQKELLSLVLEKGMDAVLDPMTQPMATTGGFSAAVSKLHGLGSVRIRRWTWAPTFCGGVWPMSSRCLWSSTGSLRYWRRPT